MRQNIDDRFRTSQRGFILGVLKHIGKKFDKCELCGKDIPKKEFEIHHEKYDGATIYDLKISCRSCNKKPENINLA